MLRAKYQEKVPWEDRVVAATTLLNKVKFVVTEDSHFAEISEIEVRRTSQLRL